jgi:hypothetical protein
MHLEQMEMEELIKQKYFNTIQKHVAFMEAVVEAVEKFLNNIHTC